MLYETGWSALQYPDENGNHDWHSNLKGQTIWDSSTSLLGEWGIFEVEEGVYRADHARAILDLIVDGKWESLEGIKDDLCLSERTQYNLCSKVYEVLRFTLHAFMLRQFSRAWRYELSKHGIVLETPFKDRLIAEGRMTEDDFDY